MKITANTVYLTKKGFKKLKKDLAQLKHDRQAVESDLREMDKKDNRDHSYARNEYLDRVAIIDQEIREKELYLRRAQILPRTQNAVEVMIGSVVDLIDRATGRKSQYQIVESLEADPSQGRISIESPLGRQLVGKKPKDLVELNVGLKTRCLELTNIQ